METEGTPEVNLNNSLLAHIKKKNRGVLIFYSNLVSVSCQPYYII